MFSTTPVRLFLLFALLALLGFAGAARTSGGTTTVLTGVAGTFAAAVAVTVEIEREGRARTATHKGLRQTG